MSSCRFYGVCILVAVASASLDARAAAPPSPKQSLEQRLKTLIDIDFEDTPLESVVATLREKSGIDIVVDQPALAESGVSLKSPVCMKLERISVRSALKLIMHQLHIASLVEGQSLLVTGGDNPKLMEQFVSITYPISDLIETRRSDRPSDGPTTGAKLIDLVTKSIAPRTWSAMGGKGKIKYSPKTSSVTVFHTRREQEQIQDLIAALRRLRDKELPPVAPQLVTPPTAR